MNGSYINIEDEISQIRGCAVLQYALERYTQMTGDLEYSYEASGVIHDVIMDCCAAIENKLNINQE